MKDMPYVYEESEKVSVTCMNDGVSIVLHRLCGYQKRVQSTQHRVTLLQVDFVYCSRRNVLTFLRAFWWTQSFLYCQMRYSSRRLFQIHVLFTYLNFTWLIFRPDAEGCRGHCSWAVDLTYDFYWPRTNGLKSMFLKCRMVPDGDDYKNPMNMK